VRTDLLELPVRRGTEPARPLGALLGDAPSMVVFWASYCPPCQAEVPVVRRAVARWRDRGVRIVGLAVGFDRPEEVTRTAREWGIDYESYWLPDAEWEAAKRLLPEGLPATFFVGRDEATRHDRVLSDDDLDRLIPRHLGVEPPTSAPPQKTKP
jgi:thiol-disulfide isomerase/thioredoxin